METLVILFSGALGGYLVPSLTRRVSISPAMSILFGLFGGLIGGYGLYFFFSPPPSFDGLLLLMGSSLVYGALMVVGAALVQTIIRTR